jgi:hypothetical protein
MTLLQRTTEHARMRLRIRLHGVEALYERPMVGGGWYIKNSVNVPWPWVKIS